MITVIAPSHLLCWCILHKISGSASTSVSNADTSPAGAPPTLMIPQHDGSPDSAARIPKNKSTGSLLPKSSEYPDRQSRFSFDAGSAQEINLLKRYTCPQHFQQGEQKTDISQSSTRRERKCPGRVWPPSYQTTASSTVSLLYLP